MVMGTCFDNCFSPCSEERPVPKCKGNHACPLCGLQHSFFMDGEVFCDVGKKIESVHKISMKNHTEFVKEFSSPYKYKEAVSGGRLPSPLVFVNKPLPRVIVAPDQPAEAWSSPKKDVTESTNDTADTPLAPEDAKPSPCPSRNPLSGKRRGRRGGRG